MKITLYCSICAILLSSCSGSSIGGGNISLFGSTEIKNSSVVSKVRGIFKHDDGLTTRFEHVPIQNPEGAQFNTDPYFVKSYKLYTKRTQKQLYPNQEVAVETQVKEIDEFSMYKLMGAEKVDISNANWDVDYISPPKEKTIGEKIMETITPNAQEEKNGIFAESQSFSEVLNQIENFFTPTKKILKTDTSKKISNVKLKPTSSPPTKIKNIFYQGKNESMNKLSNNSI